MADDDDETDETPGGPQRIDKWLWFARVVKTRTLAAGLVQTGKVRINRVKIEKPSQALKVGDVVTVAAGGRIRVLRVLAPGLRRGPASEAQTLYEDISPSPGAVGSPAQEDSGRPSKKDRRDIVRFKKGN